MNTNTPAALALAETIARRLREAEEKARALADAELLREFRLLADAAEEFRRRVREELSRRG